MAAHGESCCKTTTGIRWQAKKVNHFSWLTWISRNLQSVLGTLILEREIGAFVMSGSGSFIKFAVAAALFSVVSQTALAWTETPPAQQPAQPSAQMQGVPGVVIDPAAPQAAIQDQQTEINIPGIGSVGVLPKLDFGLDLLYGSNSEETPDAAPKNDDVIIRGTLKHRF